MIVFTDTQLLTDYFRRLETVKDEACSLRPRQLITSLLEEQGLDSLDDVVKDILYDVIPMSREVKWFAVVHGQTE